jgi:hypothetical protein
MNDAVHLRLSAYTVTENGGKFHLNMVVQNQHPKRGIFHLPGRVEKFHPVMGWKNYTQMMDNSTQKKNLFNVAPVI